MKISRNKIIAAIAWVVIPTCLFGYNGFTVALGALVTSFVVYVVVDALTEDGVNLGKRGKSIFTSTKPYNYNKYRRAYRNRR
jgi:hypothetical protein